MLIGLENVIRRIYTYRTVYPFSLKCNNIRRSEEYDNDTNDAYSIEVQQINDDGSSPIYTEIFYLPRIVRGSVKVKGRAKQGIYTALGNFKIRIGRQFFSWGNGYSGTQVIDVNWEKVDRVKLKDVYKEGLGQQIIVEFSFSNLIKYFNLWTDDLVVYFDPETLKKSEAKKSQEFAEEIPKFLNECVIPYESLLKLRLLSKDPSLQEKVGINEVKAFIELMKKGNELADMPTPLDYKFLDTYEALAEELGRGWDSRRNYYYKGTPGSNIRYETSHNFQKNGKLYLTPLQREINNFFSNKEGAMFSNVQEVTDTNALSVAEQNSKIYFEEWSNSKNGSTYEKQRLNPAYFVGVIDAIFTADSKDINIKNELTRDAVIRDGQMFIKLYNKKFEEVEVSMYDYLMSATLSPDNIDYENKKIFPVDGKYSIYKFGEYTFTTDVGEITYLRKRDGIMTDSVAMIPFVNKTQIMRSMLSAHMLTQAIPVEGSSRPFVYTGHGKEIFNQTALNQETPVDGKVTVITDEFMRIDKSDGGDPVIIKKPDTYNTANHTSNFFTPCVSVGDKVKAGQTVYSCSSFKGKELALGVPLLTAFTSFYAREHEDGMVLSESAAKKFGAKMMCKVQIPLMKQDEWFLGHNVFDELPEVDSSKFDDLGLIKLGSEVRRGDPIFACWARLDPRRSEIARLQLALDKNAIPRAIYMAKVPHKVPDGTVTRIYFNPVRGYQSNGSMTRQDFMKLATHFGTENRSFRSREAQQLGIDIRQLKDYMVKPTNFSNEEQLGEIVIEITYINPLKVSDKMANGFGGKGVVAEIVPDDKMLRTKDGQVIDIIMSPLAVISRINLSQLYVSNLGLISSNLYTRIGNYLNAGGENSDEPKWQKEGELLKECLRLVSPDNPKRTLRQAYDDAESGFIRIKATAMDRYFTAELITDLLKKLNIEDHEQLFDPIQYKWIRTPIRVGYQEFYRLHFIAEEKMKATGSIKSLGIEGYGAVRKKGQSLGEQEAHALLAWGEGDLLRKFSYEKQDKSSRFFQEMLSIGFLLQDNRDKDTATMEKGVEPEV